MTQFITNSLTKENMTIKLTPPERLIYSDLRDKNKGKYPAALKEAVRMLHNQENTINQLLREEEYSDKVHTELSNRLSSAIGLIRELAKCVVIPMHIEKEMEGRGIIKT